MSDLRQTAADPAAKLVRVAFYVALVVFVALLLLGIAVAKIEAAEYVRFRVTAYCPCPLCCGIHADGVTASGTRADHPLVAAPGRFPFGTLIQIPGYAGGRWVRVEDRGGAIKGNRLDVFFPTHAEALRWGVRWIWFRIEGG